MDLEWIKTPVHFTPALYFALITQNIQMVMLQEETGEDNREVTFQFEEE